MEKSTETFINSLSDELATGILSFCVLIFRWLPLKALVFFSKLLGTFTFYLHQRFRERVMSNLSLAFGREKDPKEIRRLAREVFFHFSLTPLETIYLAANVFPFERFILRVKIEGKEHLDAALARGKGVIALGAHLGSFNLLGTRLAVEGYPFNLIVNVGRFPRLWGKLADYQRAVGQRTIPLKPTSTSVKKSLNCLHRNEIIYIVADEQQRRRGLPVSFFGQTAFTPSGPAIFSVKTGAPILPMFVLREGKFDRTLVIKNPIEIERTTDEKKDIERLTTLFTKAIEEMVRQYPSQWTWLNRRWKSPRGASPSRDGVSQR
jgi:KDO2-lipid IV(A) lauroyltransferase